MDMIMILMKIFFRMNPKMNFRLVRWFKKDGLGDFFRQKLLIVENITDLELVRFEVGKLPSSKNTAHTVI